MFGPEMLLFHAVFVAWIVIFLIHVRKVAARYWTSKVLMSLSMFTGMLAPFHYFLRMLLVTLMFSGSGAVDPTSWIDLQANLTMGCTVVGLTAMIFLGLSTWAWMMPRPADDGRH